MIHTLLSTTIVFSLYGANPNASNLPGKQNEVFSDMKQETLPKQHEEITPASVAPKEAAVQTDATKDAAVQTDMKNIVETRGLFLIIDIRKVGDEAERLGSQADIANLWNTFASFGYEPRIVDDRDEPLTRAKLLEEVHKFAHNSRQKRHDTTVVALMSHGDKTDMLITSDYDKVSLNEVKALLESSPHLEGKAKVVIVQACRGGEEDIKAMPIDTDSQSDSRDCQGDSCIPWLLETWQRWRQSRQQQSQPQAQPSPVALAAEIQAEAPEWKIKPYGSDFVVIRSTQPGRMSYRQEILGSYLVTTLCAELRHHGRHYDLLTILYGVTKRMNLRNKPIKISNSTNTATKNYLRRELCETTNTLDKALRL